MPFPFYDDLVRGNRDLRKFLSKLGHWRVQIRMVCENTRFAIPCCTLGGVEDLTDWSVTQVVTERLSGTMNTFYLLIGEITIAPFDFVILMTLGLMGDPLVYQDSFYTHCDQLLYFFALIMESVMKTISLIVFSSIWCVMTSSEHNIHLINNRTVFLRSSSAWLYSRILLIIVIFLTWLMFVPKICYLYNTLILNLCSK